MRKLGFLFLLQICLVAVAAAPATAITLTYVDTITCSSGSGAACGGNEITYTLTYPNSASGTATFTIQNSANTTGGGQSWFAGWALFQFDQSTPAAISLTSAPGLSLWSNISGSTVNVLTGGGNYSPLPPDGRAGFVVTSLLQGNTPDITQGWLVNGSAGTATFTFDYNLPAPGVLNLDAINFMIGYYDGLSGSGAPIVNRLSATLQVPEPASLLLIGAGLVGMGVLGRKKFFGQVQDS